MKMLLPLRVLPLFYTLLLLPQGPQCAAAVRSGSGGGGSGGGSSGGGGSGSDTGTPTSPDAASGAGGSNHNPQSGPDAVIPPANPSDGQYPLGSFTSGNKRAPFQDINQGQWKQFSSNINDILKATPTGKSDKGVFSAAGTYTRPTAITTTIYHYHNHYHNNNNNNQAAGQPTNACSAWSSLSVYCGGGGTSCACYSGTYYVPEQWNSLAARCAEAVETLTTTIVPATLTSGDSTPTITTTTTLSPSLPTATTGITTKTKENLDNLAWVEDVVSRASLYATFCPTNTATVAFGAVAPTESKKSGAAAVAVSSISRIEFLVMGVVFGMLFM